MIQFEYLGGAFKHFLFSHLLGKIPILTNIFQGIQGGWNHQLDIFRLFFKMGGFSKPLFHLIDQVTLRDQRT